MICNLEEYSESFRKSVECLFVDGKCSECGACCSSLLPVTQKEINTIKVYCKNHNIKVEKHGMFAMANPVLDLTCPFLDDTKPNHKCLIYAVRPKICRIFTCKDPRNPIATRKMHQSGAFLVDMWEEFEDFN
jgi:Fe-S-cluster containining protein